MRIAFATPGREPDLWKYRAPDAGFRPQAGAIVVS
jgi:hypothetical protein